MTRKPLLVILAILLALAVVFWPRPAAQPLAGDAAALPAASTQPVASRPPAALPAFLPAEARDTISLILHDGPYPNRQDGSVFGNRERRLPDKPRGYYREYTVDTPGLDHRGARRIVAGGAPPEVWYYSDDHYETFRSFAPEAGGRSR